MHKITDFLLAVWLGYATIVMGASLGLALVAVVRWFGA